MMSDTQGAVFEMRLGANLLKVDFDDMVDFRKTSCTYITQMYCHIIKNRMRVYWIFYLPDTFNYLQSCLIVHTDKNACQLTSWIVQPNHGPLSPTSNL